MPVRIGAIRSIINSQIPSTVQGDERGKGMWDQDDPVQLWNNDSGVRGGREWSRDTHVLAGRDPLYGPHHRGLLVDWNALLRRDGPHVRDGTDAASGQLRLLRDLRRVGWPTRFHANVVAISPFQSPEDPVLPS